MFRMNRRMVGLSRLTHIAGVIACPSPLSTSEAWLGENGSRSTLRDVFLSVHRLVSERSPCGASA